MSCDSSTDPRPQRAQHRRQTGAEDTEQKLTGGNGAGAGAGAGACTDARGTLEMLADAAVRIDASMSVVSLGEAKIPSTCACPAGMFRLA